LYTDYDEAIPPLRHRSQHLRPSPERPRNFVAEQAYRVYEAFSYNRTLAGGRQKYETRVYLIPDHPQAVFVEQYNLKDHSMYTARVVVFGQDFWDPRKPNKLTAQAKEYLMTNMHPLGIAGNVPNHPQPVTDVWEDHYRAHV
jgi:hypothetical protein